MTMRSASFEEYALLSKDTPDEDDYQHQRKTSTHRMPIWVVALFTIFIALDIVTYLGIARLLSKTGTQSNELPIRYSYIGLDEMYNTTNIKPSKFDPIVNSPILATQVSRAEPNKVFPVDAHQWLSDYGTLSPPDRNFHVTSTIHTIAQFHILDWGMEKCALTIRLPPRDAVLPHEYEVKDIQGTVRLDICELDAPRPLNPLSLTWRKRPKCVNNSGTIDAKVGEEVQLEPFPCQTGTFKTFEVSCASDMPDCGLNVWSNHDDTWGLFLTQYQTV